MSEKCWTIKEKRPIKIKTVNIANSSKIRISVDANKMKYETWEHLDHHHRHQDIDVGHTSYDYSDGECEFKAQSQKDLDLWLEKYNHIVTI